MSTLEQKARIAENNPGKLRGKEGETPEADERLNQRRTEDLEPVDQEQPPLKKVTPHESFAELVTDMGENRGIELTPDMVATLQSLEQNQSATGRTETGLEWTVTRDAEGYELFTVENHRDSAAEPTPEMIDNMVRDESQKEAMRESRAYFDERFSKLDDVLGQRKDQIQELLTELQGQPADYKHSILHVRDTLGMNDKDEGVLYAISKAIHDCRPFDNVEEGYAKVVDLVKEQLDPRVQERKAREAFRSGSSWYHTTSEGQRRLALIQDKTRGDIEARLRRSQLRVVQSPTELNISTPTAQPEKPNNAAETDDDALMAA